ncbi:MAG: hypothetical protein HN406_15165 [Lentisphaerae bacterium]|nr:hypothetical protein [Lentisphaerota bacterium]
MSVATEIFPLAVQSWSVFWSPDGKRMLYRAHNEWHTIELATRKSTKIEGMGDVDNIRAWGLDGRHVAVCVEGLWTFVYKLTADGQARCTTTAPIASGFPMAFSPDGKSVLVFGGAQDERYPKYAKAIIELASGPVELMPQMSTPGRNAMTEMGWPPDGRGLAFLISPGNTGDAGRGDCAIFSTRTDFKEDPIQLIPGKELLRYPTVSPDGLGVASVPLWIRHVDAKQLGTVGRFPPRQMVQ